MNDTTPAAFRHRHAAHCESGTVSGLLTHYGLALSEPMAFGISGALNFVHLPFVKVQGFPLTAYRMPPGFIVRKTAGALGVKMRFERFRSVAGGERRLNALLDAGQPVGLQTSIYWLPYLPPEMRFHFNAHNLIAYAREGGVYKLSDPVAEFAVDCPAQDLNRARFVRGLFAPRGLLYYPDAVSTELAASRMEKAIRKGIRRTARQMLYAPLPFAGVRGIRFLARRIRRLDQRHPDPRMAKMFIAMIIRMQEEIGTGGAGFRFMYAAFLEESSALLDDARLAEGSRRMTVAGDAWREFALAGAQLVKAKSRGIGREDYAALADCLEACAEHERDTFRYLIGKA